MAAVELGPELERLVAAARRVFAGRDGRIALTLVLASTATVRP